jgi:hypothetical protein
MTLTVKEQEILRIVAELTRPIKREEVRIRLEDDVRYPVATSIAAKLGVKGKSRACFWVVAALGRLRTKGAIFSYQPRYADQQRYGLTDAGAAYLGEPSGAS